MKIFKNKILLKFIASLCIVFAIFSFLNITRVYADTDEDEVFGGALLTPITKLLTGLGDGIMDILHSSVLEQDETIIRLDGTADSWWNMHGGSVLGWLIGFVTFGLVIAGALTGAGAVVGVRIKLCQKFVGSMFYN